MNPYEAPRSTGEPALPGNSPPLGPANRWGTYGLACSACGLVGHALFLPSMQVVPGLARAFWLAAVLLPPVAVVLCSIGLGHAGPRRAAAWGLVLGIIGSLYVPTLLFLSGLF